MNNKERLLKAIDLNKRGSHKEALEIFKETDAIEGTPLILSHYALCLAVQGIDFELAQRLCLRSMKREMRNPEICLNLAKIFLLSNKKELAVKALKKGLKYKQNHRGLLRLFYVLGMRREVVVDALARESFLNRTLGAITYRLRLDREINLLAFVKRMRRERA